ncbi:targeting protein for XKLP2 [Euphorbia peplus]|nr:targeting protein for XKLP2 [Euphorbia peplus]
MDTCCTPNLPVSTPKEGLLLNNSKKHQTHVDIMVRNLSSLKLKPQSQRSKAKGSIPESVKRATNAQDSVGKFSFAQENQAVKKQKVDGGGAKQILSFKPPQPLNHKSKLGGNTNSSPANVKQNEEREGYVREAEQTTTPFVSMAEMMLKFQSSTRDLSLPGTRNISHVINRTTRPNPFHLHTEERGAEKERKFAMDQVNKQIEEERARVPKAQPYPYTTDYPVVPPKPERKPCTKPEPFPLESLTRHEEMRREMEEWQRIQKEEAQKRQFKVQPILKEDPIPLPEKVRKPLTEVKQFSLQIDDRAIIRADFDQKLKVKEQMYNRYKEEKEAARLMEEEKAVKEMRRTMVPHARPVPNFDHPFCPKK